VKLRYALLVAALPLACGQDRWHYGDVRRMILREELYTHHDLARKLGTCLKEGTNTGESHLRVDSFVIEGEPRKVIFAHPPLRLIFPVYVRKSERLVTGAALHPGCWDKEGDGVRFVVKVRTAGGQEDVLGSVYVDPKHRGGDRRWHDLSFDLSRYDGGIVGVVLETTYGSSGDGSFDWAGWVEPLVVSPDPPPQPPSIILVTVGGLRADQLGCYGTTELPTSGIDLFAAGGFVFHQAYATSDNQIRALTGLLTCRLDPHLDEELRPGVGPETIAEAAAASGYRTAAFIASRTVADNLGALTRGFQLIEEPTDKTWKASELTSKVIQWMASNVGKRFLIWLHYADLEFDARAGISTERALDAYPGLLSDVDSEFQRLLQALTAAGLDNSVIVALCSDSPRYLGEDVPGELSRSLYAHSMKIPLVLRYPQLWRGGQHLSCLVQSTDVSATLADITDMTLHIADGKSLVGILSNLASMVRDEVRGSTTAERMAMSSQWLYIEKRGKRGSSVSGQELYSLRADSGQATSVAADHPEIVREMSDSVQEVPW
jgi:arylsulfatase A-like enzyme